MRFTPSDASTPWTGDFPLSRPISGAPENGLPDGYATLDSVGGLADEDRIWQFEPGLPPELEIDTLWLTCSGFRIAFRDAPDLRAVYSADRLWIGEVPAAMSPSLFSPRHDAESLQGATVLRLPDAPVALRVESRDHRKHFVLLRAAPGETAEDLAARSRSLLPSATDLDAAWKQLTDERSAWAGALPETSKPGHALLALERVAALAVPSPQGIRWRQEADDLTLLPFCAEALAAMGPPTLNALLRHLADAPETGPGWIPRHPDRPGLPALPVWGQCLRRLPTALRQTPDFPRALERLQAHTLALLDGFPESGDALPQWPSPEAAPTPEVADAGVEVFDLACMLVAELEALEELADAPNRFQPARNALRDRILERHLSPRRKTLLDRKADGDLAGRLTCATLLPLLWSTPPSDLPPSLTTAPELRDNQGIRQWEPRDTDPAPPPLRMETQHLLLPLLDRAKDDAGAHLSAAWHRLVQARGPGADPATAALYLRLLPYEDRINPELETYPGWVLFLEHHRKTVVGTAAALLFALPILAGLLYGAQPEYGRVEEHLLAGQADIFTSLRRHAEAEDLYTHLLDNSRKTDRLGPYHLQRGNLRYRDERFEQALRDYDAAIAHDPDGYLHTARWNRAQALRRLGRTDEAQAAFEAFIAEYGDELRDLKAGAELAIRLMQP